MIKKLFLLSKACFEVALIFASSFLGAYLGLNWDKPIDNLGWSIIIIIILSIIFKVIIENKLSDYKI